MICRENGVSFPPFKLTFCGSQGCFTIFLSSLHFFLLKQNMSVCEIFIFWCFQNYSHFVALPFCWNVRRYLSATLDLLSEFVRSFRNMQPSFKIYSTVNSIHNITPVYFLNQKSTFRSNGFYRNSNLSYRNTTIVLHCQYKSPFLLLYA